MWCGLGVGGGDKRGEKFKWNFEWKEKLSLNCVRVCVCVRVYVCACVKRCVCVVTAWVAPRCGGREGRGQAAPVCARAQLLHGARDFSGPKYCVNFVCVWLVFSLLSSWRTLKIGAQGVNLRSLWWQH